MTVIESRVNGVRDAAEMASAGDPAFVAGPGDRLRDVLLRALEDVIPAQAEVALLDVPVNRNVGDWMIWLATEDFLDARDCEVSYRASRRDYVAGRLKARVSAETLLVCLGGGNLGDLYPAHQRLRESVVAAFPDHRIVVLPQTVHFVDAVAARRAAGVFRGHGGVDLLVRDHESVAAAEAMSDSVRLAPDVVHLWPMSTRARDASSGERLAVLRRDGEAAARSGRWAGNSRPLDWPDVVSSRPVLGAGLTALASGAAARSRWQSDLQSRWHRYCERAVERAFQRFRRAESVVTDRLHAALCGILCGCSTELIDAGYGKLGRYHRTWLRDVPHAVLRSDS